MKRTILLSVLLCSIIFISQAQTVKFKKDKVLVDKNEFLSFERSGTAGAISYDLSELNSGKRIILLVQNNGGTISDISDDLTKIKFLSNGGDAEISGGDLRNAIKLLIKNEVLKEDGTLDESKIEVFIKNYDEKISERTIIK